MTENAPIFFCANHPKIQTSLRCNRCEKPICTRCAVLTPTGYRCKDCVRGQQKVFVTAQWYDYVIGIVVAGVLSLIVSVLLALVAGMIGFFSWFLIIVASPAAGIMIAEVCRFALRKRRANALFVLVALAAVLGVLPMSLLALFGLNIFGLIYQVIYVVLAVPTLYYRLSGRQLFK